MVLAVDISLNIKLYAYKFSISQIYYMYFKNIIYIIQYADQNVTVYSSTVLIMYYISLTFNN